MVFGLVWYSEVRILATEVWVVGAEELEETSMAEFGLVCCSEVKVVIVVVVVAQEGVLVAVVVRKGDGALIGSVLKPAFCCGFGDLSR